MLLKDKVAIVTGSGRGIGRATALKFAENGAAIVLNSVREETVQRVSAEIAAIGGHSVYVSGDVTESGMPERIFQTAVDAFGRVDILVNNAGTGEEVHSLDMKYSHWQYVMDLNLNSALKLSLLCLQYFKENGGGNIVSVSSIAAKRPNDSAPSYDVSKAALMQLMRHFAREFGGDNIRCNSVLPGLIDTELIAAWTPERRAVSFSTIPMKRGGLPEEVANAILFLASDMSSFITGESVAVNGGAFMD